MKNSQVVSREQWLEARQELLSKEKEFTRLREQLTQQRQALPWVQVEKEYIFSGPNGTETLADLFEGRSQLIVYHFMLGPGWQAGCVGCSFWADNFNNIIVHLNQRDITMLAVSRGQLEEIEAYKKRMGWTFKWVSSFGSDFNYDYHVSFPPGDPATDEVFYNYQFSKFSGEEEHGISVFYKDDARNIFHTYSCYSRGVEMQNTAYHYMDLVPKGRDEDRLSYATAWLRRHDQYDV